MIGNPILRIVVSSYLFCTLSTTNSLYVGGTNSAAQHPLVTAVSQRDALMALYSDAYVGQQGEDKAGVRTFLEQAAAMGYLDGLEIDISGGETSIEEGKATVGPLVINGPMGAINFTMKLAKEEAGWLIVGGEQG